MREQTGYLTLKEAARMLGVHEQTLRSWERRGLIHLVRLPGSQYRRVPADEVNRLKREMEGYGQPVSIGVRVEPPPTDPETVAQGRLLADEIKRELAAREAGDETLDDVMRRLRGRTWSP